MAVVNVTYSLPEDVTDKKIVVHSGSEVQIKTFGKTGSNGLGVSNKRLQDPSLRPAYYYTGPPWSLLWSDTKLFLWNIAFLPGIVFPLWAQPPARSFHLGVDNRFMEQPRFVLGKYYRQFQAWAQKFYHSGPMDELYPSWNNFCDITFHMFLMVTQSAFLVSLPFLTFLSFNVFVTWVVFFVTTNYLACFMLNGWMPEGFIWSKEFRDTPRWREEHADEEWIFLNGVAVGKNWLQSNIDRISLTFHREVKGVHNRTAGIIFDVIQCLLERCVYFGTANTRICFSHISDALLNSKKTKVVLILHSQGGLEGSIILDWLINQHPREVLQKLEIFTFGNAANHFNNPRVKKENAVARPKDRAIRHIEHYANSRDFVSRWGVLHFKKQTARKNGRFLHLDEISNLISKQVQIIKATTKTASKQANKLDSEWNAYQGVLIERSGSGHQFNQHYLDNMFPLDASLSRVQTNGDGSPLPGTFMASRTHVCNDPWKIHEKRNMTNGVDGNAQVNGHFEEDQQVYQISRLWKYVNGRSPSDKKA
ncbi:hypothetical protein LY78DRAFT_694432 [Colletotrichum sublineola]|uniref:Uncharacterized protein n=1 Tax=Colletotrichum sublineola TaxID=1173701 RepID=A0A066X0Y2_COLSU|nr:hypothetical protein LY78DRAFT_694432 [Colletotrichum sublineola]KDN62607.1 hypothetical protein CSUB01_05495 [Colletotrichum sublineola]